jgi:hypothetical protein
MKIIDLLKKIANGNIPKRIIYDEYVYVWNNKIENYEREIDIDTTLNWDYIAINCLNEPVEILEEEHKIPEKIITTSLRGIDNLDEKIEVAHVDTISAIDKINEILDYLEVNNG